MSDFFCFFLLIITLLLEMFPVLADEQPTGKEPKNSYPLKMGRNRINESNNAQKA